MIATLALDDRPFRTLRRALARRRIAAIEPRLKLEILLLAALLDAFLFWQFRVRLAATASASGPRGVALETLASLAALALGSGAFAGARLARRLRRDAAGPPWLALPIPPALLARHLSSESRLEALWVALAAPAILAA